MSWGNSGNDADGRLPGDERAADRPGRLRARLVGEVGRLRDRARRLWGERAEPRLLGGAAPGAGWEHAPASLSDAAPAAWHGRQGSLRSRLLWSFVGVAALAALIVGIVTLSLVRLASVSGLEQQLRDQADVASSIGAGPAPCVTLASLRAVQTELYLVTADGSPQPVTCRPFRGRLSEPVAPPPEVDLRMHLAAGTVKTGSRGSVVYAIAPLQRPVQTVQGVSYDGVLLTHSLGGLGIGLVGGVAWRLLLATTLAMAIAALVAWLLASRLTAPLRRLAGAARQLGAGQLATRVQVEGDDEVAEVGAAFNEMAADIEQSQGEQRAILASVSHELKTPLTAVQGYTEALLDGTIDDPPARQRTLERIHGETLRLARLVQDLIDLARLGRGQFAVSLVDADVTAVLRETVAAAAERAAAQGVVVEQRVPDHPLLAHVDPGRLRQVLDNPTAATSGRGTEGPARWAQGWAWRSSRRCATRWGSASARSRAASTGEAPPSGSPCRRRTRVRRRGPQPGAGCRRHASPSGRSRLSTDYERQTSCRAKADRIGACPLHRASLPAPAPTPGWQPNAAPRTCPSSSSGGSWPRCRPLVASAPRSPTLSRSAPSARVATARASRVGRGWR